ncbi:hypothetical protein ACTQ40_04845 [Collinsella sp. Sow4_D11]|uniref:hypothetical protein n=1 Tax=Collinsella sp. Sow4_D11 TaxID=3438775 RepID=UPI003F923924
MTLANHLDEGIRLILGFNMDQLGNKPALAIHKLARSLNIRSQSKVAVQQSPSTKLSTATNSLNNTAKTAPLSSPTRAKTPMMPSPTARTRQREQGALKDEIATEMRLPMTRQKQRDAKNGTADDSVNESENPSARARCLERRGH